MIPIVSYQHTSSVMVNPILAKRAPNGFDLSAVQNFPAATPPPGIIPNFDDPESRGPVFTIAGAVLLGFMLVFSAIRAYAKICIIKRIHWDDCEFELLLQL